MVMAMTLNQLVLRSMRKNAKNYYLYVFALIFSVTLYYSFVTLQYNPTITKEIGNGMSSTILKAASYLLLFIVTFFVLYANKLFMNRRSKEIGLYQLVGMPKGLVTRLIAIENIILWLGAIILGVFTGFITSRIFVMILLKILEKDAFVELSFSLEALLRTVIVFLLLLMVVILQTAIRIRRVSLLTLITTTVVADERVKRFNVFQMFLGFIGLAFIGYGYYLSTTLLDLLNDPSMTPNTMLFQMVLILALTVGGTYFVFRFSVAFILNIVRKSKKGLMSVSDVLSLSTIMHRMKSSAMSLTTITILSATTLGILTLAYISYYSADAMAQDSVAYDYIMYEDTGFDLIDEFDKEGIQYTRRNLDLLAVQVNFRSLLVKEFAQRQDISTLLTIQVVSQKDIQSKLPNLQLKEDEGYIVGYDSLRAENIKLESQKPIQFTTSTGIDEIFITEITEESIAPNYHDSNFIVIVSDSYFQNLLQDPLNENQKVVGIELKEKGQLKKAEEVFEANKVSVEVPYPSGLATKTVSVESQETYRLDILNSLGLTIFIAGFLGLGFLITTGSILYFKQMSEADEEKGAYTILRKMGFTTNEIMKGIRRKQLFNFGFPLLIGLAHSYFAVKAAWIFFGTELMAPLLITMCVYVILYSIFAILSAGYYRKVVEDAL